MRQLAEAIVEVAGTSRNSSNRPGIWEGRVEDINDPRRLNRIRVRCFQLHGDKQSTSTGALPWAELVDIGGGGYDYGSGGALYPIGSTVYIMFKQGDDRFPVIIGGKRGDTQRDSKNPGEFNTLDGTTEDGITTPWLPPEGNEQPKDIFDESVDGDTLPTRTVWNKSYRGHTILVEDRAGYEFLKIIDRAGQVIEMNCPVTEDANANNAQQRGARNASNDTQLTQESLVNSRGFIRIKDVGGNEILLDGAAGSESITIKSVGGAGTSEQVIKLSSAQGKEQISMIDKMGNKIVLDPNNPSQSIIIQDFAGNMIVFDAEKGQVITKSTSIQVSEVGGTQSKIVGDREDQISGSDSATIAGNKILTVLNDLSGSIAGMSSFIFGGAVTASIANTPPSGIPATTALDVSIALGGFSFKTQVNASPISIGTLAGNIAITTLAGNVEMSTVAGTADFGSKTATTTIEGPLGISLGAVAPFSICYGEGAQAAFNIVGALAATDIRVCLGVPVPPTTLAGLPAALAALTAPGLLFSLFNKTA